MCFHPRMHGDTVIPQMGIGNWNPYGNTSQIYVGGQTDRSMRIGNYNIKNFNAGTRDTNYGTGGHLYPGNTWVGLTNYWMHQLRGLLYRNIQ